MLVKVKFFWWPQNSMHLSPSHWLLFPIISILQSFKYNKFTRIINNKHTWALQWTCFVIYCFVQILGSIFTWWLPGIFLYCVIKQVPPVSCKDDDQIFNQYYTISAKLIENKIKFWDQDLSNSLFSLTCHHCQGATFCWNIPWTRVWVGFKLKTWMSAAQCSKAV